MLLVEFRCYNIYLVIHEDICVCVYVCTYVCVYMCIYIYLSTYVRTYIRMCLRTCIYERNNSYNLFHHALITCNTFNKLCVLSTLRVLVFLMVLRINRHYCINRISCFVIQTGFVYCECVHVNGLLHQHQAIYVTKQSCLL
jgi:hypothetical protein